MKVHFKLTGQAPLIVQSDRLVDMLDPLTKELKANTKKRGRTDEDELEKYRLQFYGSLYYDAAIGPYIPGSWLQASLRDGGTKSKQGKAIMLALLVTSDVMPLDYTGPRDIDELWEKGSVKGSGSGDFRFLKAVKQGQARIMRCRPWFRKWALVAEGELQTDVMDFADLKRVAETAGNFAGMGGWRPSAPRPGLYGRYQVEVSK